MNELKGYDGLCVGGGVGLTAIVHGTSNPVMDCMVFVKDQL